jgi:hypothetical protein
VIDIRLSLFLISAHCHRLDINRVFNLQQHLELYIMAVTGLGQIAAGIPEDGAILTVQLNLRNEIHNNYNSLETRISEARAIVNPLRRLFRDVLYCPHIQLIDSYFRAKVARQVRFGQL